MAGGRGRTAAIFAWREGGMREAASPLRVRAATPRGAEMGVGIATPFMEGGMGGCLVGTGEEFVRDMAGSSSMEGRALRELRGKVESVEESYEWAACKGNE